MTDFETQLAITDIHRFFELQLESIINLNRVTAPLFVKSGTGINDNLNGTETPVSFRIPALNCNAEIVHSLAKWKRIALQKYGITKGNGIYTNMNAIRREELPDELHSIYVDQWDWEKVIDKHQRTLEYLKFTVSSIYYCIKETYSYICNKYHLTKHFLPETIKFITAEELCKMYPDKTPKDREKAYMSSNKENYALFVIGIGDKLSDGKPHDGRSPDYDDWSLNGDLLLFDIMACRVVEISSMGIRVDKDSLQEQLKKTNTLDRLQYTYHKGIINEELPLTIGGGIGQSRLCMFLLHKYHIKEVQESIWN